MQKEKIIKLLIMLKQKKIEKEENVKKILNYDERILESLLDFDNDIEMALNVVDSFTKVEDVLEALSILKSAMKKESYVFDNVYRVLRSKNAIQAGIALKGASLILEAKEEFQAKYACNVLTNFNAIIDRTALEGAEAILGAKEEFQAKYACNVLINETASRAGIALVGAKAILTVSSVNKAYYIFLAVIDSRITRAGLGLDAVKIISSSNEDELLHIDKDNIIDFIKKSLNYIGSLINFLNEQPPKSDIKVRRLTKPFKKKK